MRRRCLILRTQVVWLALRGEKIGQVGRQGRIEGQPLAGRRMDELQVGGVQKLARRQWKLCPTIDAVADDRMPDRGEMHANLMRAPRFELQLYQRAPADLSQHLEAS